MEDQWDVKKYPFIFYTATYTDPKDKAFALSLGADAFLIKPMEPDKLIDAVDGFWESTTEDGRSPAEPNLPEDEVYKLYSERLIQKLEQKSSK